MAISQLEKELIKAWFAIRDRRIDDMDVATATQTKELARRLEDLNHAHQKSVEDRAYFLPREIFDATLNEWQGWRTDVNTARAEAKGRAAVLAALVSIGVGFIVLLINHFWK